MFTKIDKQFFDVILSYSDKFEKGMNDTLKYELIVDPDIFETSKITGILNGKSEKYTIVIIGSYDSKKKKFDYVFPPNTFYDHLKEQFFEDMIGSSELHDKLFVKSVSIEDKYHIIIPYLISIYSPGFNLVRFGTPDGEHRLYALINLGLKQHITQKDFENFCMFTELLYKPTGAKDSKKKSNVGSKKHGSNKSKSKK